VSIAATRAATRPRYLAGPGRGAGSK
jgi:hypothetical protein